MLIAQSVSLSQSLNGTDNYAVTNYGTSDGLPSAVTTSTVRDKMGFLWVGTQNGLTRFDGHSFRTLYHAPNDSTTISGNSVTALCSDAMGYIWVATSNGLNLFDPVTEKFTRFNFQDAKRYGITEGKIKTLLCDAKGVIWLGTESGLERFNRHTREFSSVVLPAASSSEVPTSVNAIVEQKDFVWVGTNNLGLCRVNKKNGLVHCFANVGEHGESTGDIRSICLDGAAKIWVGTFKNGLCVFDTENELFSEYSPSNVNFYDGVFSVINHKRDVLIVGDSRSFYRLNTKNGEVRQISGTEVHRRGNLWKDRSGMVWISSVNGLAKLDPRQLKFRFFDLSVDDANVQSIIAEPDMILYGTSKGLFSSNKMGMRLNAIDGKNKVLNGAEIKKLYKDRDGLFWIITGNSFFSFNKDNNEIRQVGPPTVNGAPLADELYRDIIQLHNGKYALATSVGLRVFDLKQNKFVHYNFPEKGISSAANHITCLLQTADDFLWIGTKGKGLKRLDLKSGKVLTYISKGRQNEIANNNIYALYQDKLSNLWVCTADGLNLYNKQKGSFKTFSIKAGFSSNVFNSVAGEDQAHRLWLLTEKGLSVFDYQHGTVNNYDERDGFRLASGASQSASGMIYIAGRNGVTWFNPNNIHYNNTPPPVYFTDLLINHHSVDSRSLPIMKKLNIEQKIVIPDNESTFTVDFAALNFTQPDKNRYAYYLQGFDKRWVYTGNQRRASYTNLDPGTYTLHVIAANNDGTWNKVGRKLVISVSPPWYMTWWAYTAFASAAFLLLYLYLANRKKRYSEIKRVNLEKDKEREVSERKLAFFTNISHEFRTPLTLIINPVKELLSKSNASGKDELDVIYRNSTRLLGLIDHLLQFRRSDAGSDQLALSVIDLPFLLQDIYLCFTQQASSRNIKLACNCDCESLSVLADKQKIEIAVFNLISNAMKFTPDNGAIEITLKCIDEMVSLTVSDTGPGIHEADRDKIYNRFYTANSGGAAKHGFGIGLYLVKSYIEIHNGTVTHYNRPSGGSTFHIMFPLLTTNTFTPEPSLDNFVADNLKADAPLKQATDEVLDFEIPVSDKKAMLVIDDNEEMRNYLKKVYQNDYDFHQASSGEEGLQIAKNILPDIIVSDIKMDNMSGIDFCRSIKQEPDLNHIPILLLTGSVEPECKLKGLEAGAFDFLNKPFDIDMLSTRIKGILQDRQNLEKYYYNEVTLKSQTTHISDKDKDFINRCVDAIENHILDNNFELQVIADNIGVTYATLFKKIKVITGQTVNAFVRYVRLRKAAELMIQTSCNVNEAALSTGFNDIKYFREQFQKQFGTRPSEFIRKHRATFNQSYRIKKV
ncbi:hybrid sensor histidine kinase/response regulator transcription factor [Mucilaginibacter auburnensis]|uniref:hybrid sensor histidine kinase/response regulator transcription factor n=1 Tax=Mucilaginibacter auburnensis TaxID=1457233 RepID=UPI001476124C|nr:two-component regulator propeller domain-containing protein [Mucilaginibacter auburnensis]